MTPLLSMAWTLIGVAVLLLVVTSIKDNDDAEMLLSLLL